jgi:hypothetical protein
MNHQAALVVDMVLKLLLLLVELLMVHHHQAHKFNNGLLMLKASFKIQIHKSFVVQLPVVFKLIHKTSEFDSFNHHLYHPQALSSSKKSVHLNHLHHHLFVFVNKLHLFLNHLHLFFVNDHHNHQLQLLHKLLFVD